MVEAARNAFKEFNKELEAQVTFGGVVLQTIQNITLLYTQFINQFNYLHDQQVQQGDSRFGVLFQQQVDLIRVFDQDLVKLVAIFIKEMRKSGEDDAEAVAERMEAVVA